jgi:hypothetical protein
MYGSKGSNDLSYRPNRSLLRLMAGPPTQCSGPSGQADGDEVPWKLAYLRAKVP